MRHRPVQFALGSFAVLCLTHVPCLAAEYSFKTDANVMVEVTLQSGPRYTDPFNEVTLDASFTAPDNTVLKVPGFWAGGDTWKIRFASPTPGIHKFKTECSNTKDTGLNGISGTVEVKPYHGTNPLYLHGPVVVSPNKRFFLHADGSPFFWLGDTWWMGLCHRLHWPDEFQTVTADRKQKGFNVIQIVAGLYPDMPPFDPRGANEAGFPWETNYCRIRPEYFDAADQRLGYLVEQGIVPCIVGSWGYFMPWMGVEKMKAHWRYLLARYGAYPVVWCAAGEANLPWYLAKGFPFDDRNQVKDWTEVMRYIRATDPFHRLLTVHPTAINKFTSRHATEDAALLDFDMLQTPHGRAEAVPTTIQAVRESVAALPVMPVIDGEASYEMLNDNLPTEWTRRMFWVCLLNGAAGHTYGANGIWQCNRPGEPHGRSPHGGSYGKIPWNEAMNLPGSSQLGFGKAFFEKYGCGYLTSHPQWAAYQEMPTVSLDGCNWVWFPEGDATKDAPAAKRYFRRAFEVPVDKAITRAQLRVSADDFFEASLNGSIIGRGEDWHSGNQFDELARQLRPGTNILAIMAENKPAPFQGNPAGLIAKLDIQFADGSRNEIVSDGQWRCSQNESPSWASLPFDDRSWPAARKSAAYGARPWGRLVGPNDAAAGPQAAGCSNRRIIYVPENRAIIVRDLENPSAWTGNYFDPVTGIESPLSIGPLNRSHEWLCPPPPNNAHDWVIVLTR